MFAGSISLKSCDSRTSATKSDPTMLSQSGISPGTEAPRRRGSSPAAAGSPPACQGYSALLGLLVNCTHRRAHFVAHPFPIAAAILGWNVGSQNRLLPIIPDDSACIRRYLTWEVGVLVVASFFFLPLCFDNWSYLKCPVLQQSVTGPRFESDFSPTLSQHGPLIY